MYCLCQLLAPLFFCSLNMRSSFLALVSNKCHHHRHNPLNVSTTKQPTNSILFVGVAGVACAFSRRFNQLKRKVNLKCLRQLQSAVSQFANFAYVRMLWNASHCRLLIVPHFYSKCIIGSHCFCCGHYYWL